MNEKNIMKIYIEKFKKFFNESYSLLAPRRNPPRRALSHFIYSISIDTNNLFKEQIERTKFLIKPSSLKNALVEADIR